ncbi:DUF721 domain-containing protein [Treponema sp. HNW]|uniref:DUF721 domain-containing protein n=1 Tax=Treponema sp. HNW TaxID=3116654 RepID=UPI003D0CDD49
MGSEDFSVQSAGDVLNNLFSDVLSFSGTEGGSLEKGWKKVLLSVRGYGEERDIGEKLAAHSRIIDLKNDVLFLETDHSGWIQLFGLYKKRILAALKKEFPELKINGFSFTLKKSKQASSGELRNITVEEKERWLEERGV